jgi:nucleoside 2-deoxyribosyltransferase
VASSAESVTIGTPNGDDDAPVCFVIMPFTERDDDMKLAFSPRFSVVYSPQLRRMQVSGSRRPSVRGSDVIQRTIVKDLLQADLVLADLSEHNPNVLFELGMRMHEDRPVALVRAKGTRPIFDVDNMLRVADYNPNLWPSTVERDIPTLSDHIKATWNNKDSADTFMKILRREGS